MCETSYRMAFTTPHALSFYGHNRRLVTNRKTDNPLYLNGLVLPRRWTVTATSASASTPPSSIRDGVLKPPETPQTASKTKVEQKPESADFDWLNQWYALYLESDVQPYQPYSLTVWNKPLVLFMDALADPTNRYIVLDDVCSHRAAPLSEGRVIVYSRQQDGPRQTVIECAYHGWKFDCSGKCVDVPTIPLDGPIRPRANLRQPYPVHVAAGLIFVWLGDENPIELHRPTPDVPLEFEHAKYLRRPFRRIFPFDFLTLLENVSDPAHVPWAHHSYQGNRYKVTRDGKMTLTGHNMALGSIVAEITSSTIDFQEMTFKAPGMVDFKMRAGKIEIRACFFATPMTPERSCLHFVSGFLSLPLPMQFLLKSRAPWTVCVDGHAIVDSDAMILFKQYALLRGAKSDPAGSSWKEVYGLAHVEWDSLCLAIRRFFLRYKDSMPESWLKAWKNLPPAPDLKPEDALDRYHSHTVHCVECTQALQQTRWKKFIALVIAAGMSVVCICGGLIAVVVASAATGLAAGAGAQANSVIGTIVSVALVILLISLLTVKRMADREKLFILTTEPYERSRRS